jgi:hypothetical protein
MQILKIQTNNVNYKNFNQTNVKTIKFSIKINMYFFKKYCRIC